MIEVKNARKHYRGFDLDLSITIPKGRVSGIVGRNGAGKSTLIRLILGLCKADEGNVSTLGENSFDLKPETRERIGVSMSESGFSVLLDIRSITGIMKKMYRNFDEEDFLLKVRKAGLPLDKDLGSFSTGMKAKLRVLIALSHSAELLILDEPTSGLDVVARNEVLDMIRSYMSEDENRSLLISSHISSDLEGICDDIYLIDNGKIIFHEDTDVLMSNYAVLKMSDRMYEDIDKEHLLKTRKTGYGYDALTDQKQYYAENYHDLVIENGNIDEIIVFLTNE